MMATGVVGFVISVIFVVVQLVPNLTAMEAMGAELKLYTGEDYVKELKKLFERRSRPGNR